jgi:hypothetical protein
VNQVELARLYKTTGSPSVPGEGALTAGVVTRVKVAPPSVETEQPEILMGLALRPASRCSNDNLLRVIRVSPGKCLRLRNVGEVSVPVIRLTSPAPYRARAIF